MIKRSNIYRREEIDGYESLEKLALDFLWSWNKNHAAHKIWEELDPSLWKLLRNPWVVLQTISRENLESKLANPTFRKFVDDLIQSNEAEMKSSSWFQQKHASSALKCVAYFSMEYMLTEALPIYSGGLGNVAGDQLKAASDLGVPVIAIGLLYQQGYFRQLIDKDGWQHALYPYNDPGQLPITPLRTASGEWLRLEIALPGWSVWLRAWEVKVGRVKLYLLDSNDAVNYPVHRGITSELYGGDSELRLKQELVLGIGGWRLLQALGIKPDVCHLNEGHAAFAILERIVSFMKETGTSFEEALATTRAGNLFTTHTAVPAGFDRFSSALIEQYLGKYAQEQLGLSTTQLLALGRQNPQDTDELFNMAYLALRGSGAVNGVSRLHGDVSRHIFEPIFPRWPEAEVPIGYVTNGVHTPSWGSIEANNLWAEFAEPCHKLGIITNSEKSIRCAPDNKLWQMRNNGRKALIEFARTRLTRMWASRGFPPEEVERAKTIFDPNTLTLGFARRFATYKRPNMLLHDPERLLRILTNANRPVQLLISGKAHPADKPGQAMIREWIKLFDRPQARAHVIFLSDYDMLVTEYLVRGVDLWLNTPRRPWEACGTSGMKVLVNGGINLSELDGWWVEAYTPEVGWALGDTHEHGTDEAWDAAEANTLYDILEHQVVPEFYNRDAEGIPTAWVKRIRNSMAELTSRFSANRAVSEYTEKHYVPAAESYFKRSKDKATYGKLIVKWQKAIDTSWPALRFGETKITSTTDQHTFEIQVYLDDLDPNMIKVQLFESGTIHEMKNIRSLTGTKGMYIYGAAVPATHPATDYTARIVPAFEGVAVPLEDSHILWQK
jgi:starch phosphorylase